MRSAPGSNQYKARPGNKIIVPVLSPEIESLLGGLETTELMAFLHREDCPVEILTNYAYHNNHFVRSLAIRNPKMPPEIIQDLANSESDAVRLSVAETQLVQQLYLHSYALTRNGK